MNPVARRKILKLLFLMLFIAGGAIRAIDVYRPVDGGTREAWRECDTASIARNYYREDMDILNPRIDWRGDGPGLVEIEFPAFPWLIALLYELFGVNEVFGRILSYIISLAALAVFFALARHLLPGSAGIGASLFFVLSPLAVNLSHSLQPDGLMFLFYILAVYAFVRWLEEESWSLYFVALSATACTILAKLSAAHIGLLFLLLLLEHKGFGELKRMRAWVFAISALLPAFIWYSYAHGLWLEYGNSMGISNEYHWFGLEFFTDPSFIKNILRLEILGVWMPAGCLVFLYVLLTTAFNRVIKISLFWLLAIFVFYAAAMRTTGDGWALYYHVVSVPPAALLIGAGIRHLEEADPGGELSISLLLFCLVVPLLLIVLHVAGLFQPDRFMKLSMLHVMPVIAAAAATWFIHRKSTVIGVPPDGKKAWLKQGGIFVLVFCLFATYLHQGMRITAESGPDRLRGLYNCAMSFLPRIPPNALIVSSGGPCRDENGYPVAYNASYMFYWLDRKGFNVCKEEQSIETLQSFASSGAGYFIAEKSALMDKPGFQEHLMRVFPVVHECEDAFLFKIRDDM